MNQCIGDEVLETREHFRDVNSPLYHSLNTQKARTRTQLFYFIDPVRFCQGIGNISVMTKYFTRYVESFFFQFILKNGLESFSQITFLQVILFVTQLKLNNSKFASDYFLLFLKFIEARGWNISCCVYIII